MTRLEHYFALERRVLAIEERHYKLYRTKMSDWPPMVEAYPIMTEMAHLRTRMTPAERQVLAGRSDQVDWKPFPGPFYNPGDRAFFEYHCYEGDDSSDALLWYHSCQYCTVLRAEGRDEELLYGPGYTVRFDDGFEWGVVSDELFRRRFTVSAFRAANRDERWYTGEGCRPADTVKAQAYRTRQT